MKLCLNHKNDIFRVESCELYAKKTSVSPLNSVYEFNFKEGSLGSDKACSLFLFLLDMCRIEPLRWIVASLRDAELVLRELRLSSFPPASRLGDSVLSFGLPAKTRTRYIIIILTRLHSYARYYCSVCAIYYYNIIFRQINMPFKNCKRIMRIRH